MESCYPIITLQAILGHQWPILARQGNSTQCLRRLIYNSSTTSSLRGRAISLSRRNESSNSNSMKQTAVIYARVSSVTDRQDTQRQVQDLLKYAQAQDIEVVHIFEEHISGAKKNEERAILNECLDFCVANSVRFLLLSELSRLGRSTLQVLRSLERLHEAGVSVFIQNLGLYSLQADGRLTPLPLSSSLFWLR